MNYKLTNLANAELPTMNRDRGVFVKTTKSLTKTGLTLMWATMLLAAFCWCEKIRSHDMKKKISIFLLSIAFSGATQAGSVGGTGGAMETTQYLNYGELFSQTNTAMSALQTQISQLDNLRKQVEAGGRVDWNLARSVIGSVATTVRQSQAIGYDSAVMATRWNMLYPDFSKRTGADYAKQYIGWSKESNNAIKTALSVNGLQAANFDNEAATRSSLDTLVSDANSSQSNIAAVNATNHIAMGQLDELSKLRQIQMAQNQAQLTYLQGQQQTADTKTAQDNVLREMFSEKAKTRKYEELLKLNK